MISQEEWMDIKLLNRQGMSIRAIARTTGLSRNTVRRALSQKTPTRYSSRPPRPQKLDEYKDYLLNQLETRQWAPAIQLYREILSQGYRGKYESVKIYCRQIRRQQQASQRACVRFETAPGQEAQFDWKGPLTGVLDQEPETKVFIFRLVLAYSRYRITRAVTRLTLPAILADLIDVLTLLGGVPAKLVFDNFKAAVIKPRPHLRLQPFFADFCEHYSIEPAPALPYSPQRKGKTERSFRDLEQSDLLHQTYPDLTSLQRALDEDDRSHAGRIHSTTGEAPAARLERERLFLGSLPEVAFDPRLVETRRVLSDCTISYQGAYYSVPHFLVGKRLTLKADPRTAAIEIFDGPLAVALHQQALKGERVIIEEHIAPLRQPRWDRVRRGSPLKAKTPVTRPAEAQLVPWPLVPVLQRPLEQYVTLIEEVSR